MHSIKIFVSELSKILLFYSRGKTASERWKLFKNITKLGLQRQHNQNDSENNFPVSYLYTNSSIRN